MRIGILLSGSGSTFENLFNKIKELKTPAEIVVVISSKANAYGITRAQKLNIPNKVIEYKNYKNEIDVYSNEITKVLKEYRVELVVMGGFMSFYKIPDEFTNKVLNVHPALIPSFCGQGMYGDKVHKAVYEAGVKVTGCTVHFVDNKYDNGPIVAQSIVEINIEDTPETISEKVVAAERELYPKVVDAYVRGALTFKDSKVFIKK